MNSNSITVVMPSASPKVLELLSGSVPIEGLVIFNNTNMAVSVYVGTQSPGSTPSFLVPGQSYMAFPITGSNYVTLTFAATSGYVYVQWQDEPVITGSSSIPLPSTLPITTFAFELPLYTASLGTFTDALGHTIAFAYFNDPTSIMQWNGSKTVYMSSLEVSGIPPYVTAGIAYTSGVNTPSEYPPSLTMLRTGFPWEPILTGPGRAAPANPYPISSDILFNRTGSPSPSSLWLCLENFDNVAQLTVPPLTARIAGYFQ